MELTFHLMVRCCIDWKVIFWDVIYLSLPLQPMILHLKLLGLTYASMDSHLHRSLTSLEMDNLPSSCVTLQTFFQSLQTFWKWCWSLSASSSLAPSSEWSPAPLRNQCCHGGGPVILSTGLLLPKILSSNQQLIILLPETPYSSDFSTMALSPFSPEKVFPWRPPNCLDILLDLQT